ISPDKEYEEKTLFLDVLHDKLREEAFLTRLNGVIPGWELEPIKKREISITRHYGFMADYFSEILHGLRKSYIHHHIAKQKIKLKNANIRDENSIIKIVSGLLKIIYPNGKIEDDIFFEIVKYAVEARQYVIDQNFYITGKKDYDIKLEWDVKE
ncbi:MAG: BREX system Lon protease-like protein BrxL, partial [Natronincolaceae bacterium]